MCNDNKERNRKKKVKLKIILKIIAAIASILLSAATISVIVYKNNQVKIEENNKSNVIINHSDGGDISTWVNNGINNNINNNINNYIQQDYDFENMSQYELQRRAREACLFEDYNYAYDIYRLDQMKKSKVALINLGYIYANGLAYEDIDFEQAEKYYLNADCVEAKRNLLVLYLDFREDEEKIIALIDDLLWQENDEVTWDYMTRIIYGLSLENYLQENYKEDFTYDISLLFQWEYSGQKYEGQNPPFDNERSRWIAVGMEWIDDTPYSVYEEQQIKYSIYLNLLENIYYEEDGKLIPLKI